MLQTTSEKQGIGLRERKQPLHPVVLQKFARRKRQDNMEGIVSYSNRRIGNFVFYFIRTYVPIKATPSCTWNKKRFSYGDFYGKQTSNRCEI